MILGQNASEFRDLGKQLSEKLQIEMENRPHPRPHQALMLNSAQVCKGSEFLGQNIRKISSNFKNEIEDCNVKSVEVSCRAELK